MIAVDTDLLVHALRRDSPFHEEADACVAQCAEGRSSWAIPWPCVHEFFSMATHPRIYNPPRPTARALAQIDAWLESPSLVLLTAGEQHWTTLRDLLCKARIAGPAVHDARIAALCLQHGVRQLWSADRDFGRFASLRVVNPLTGPRAAVAARRSAAQEPAHGRSLRVLERRLKGWAHHGSQSH